MYLSDGLSTWTMIYLRQLKKQDPFELLTIVLKISGVVALQIGTARNMDAINNDVMRTWLSTLGILLVWATGKIRAMDGQCKGGWGQVWAFCGIPRDLIGTTVTPKSASSYTVAITSRMSRASRETFQTSRRSNFLNAASRFI